MYTLTIKDAAGKILGLPLDMEKWDDILFIIKFETERGNTVTISAKERG